MHDKSNIAVENVEYISIASFLAGALLNNKNIPILEFSKMSSEFCLKNNVYISDDDYCKIAWLTIFDENGFCLKMDYYDSLLYNDIEYNVRDYLFSLTNDKVRKYFNLNLDCEVNFINDEKVMLKKRRN